MSKASTLIGDHPGDTVGRCADITQFLRQAVVHDDCLVELGESGTMGLFWIMQAVEDALRYEAGRVTAKSE